MREINVRWRSSDHRSSALLDFGYEPRRRQQRNHQDDREAIVSEPSTEFASPLWSNWKWHLWVFFGTAKERRKLAAAWVGIGRSTCENNRAGFCFTSRYESRDALGQSFIINSVRPPFAGSGTQTQVRPKSHFHRDDAPAKHPQEGQNIPPTRIKVLRYSSRQNRGGRHLSPPPPASQDYLILVVPDRKGRAANQTNGWYVLLTAS
jgi:hypothetical protein